MANDIERTRCHAMLNFSDELTVMVAMEPIDMRCGIDRLTFHVVNVLESPPQSKTLFLFTNKHRNKLKGLLWDRNGFILLYKRVERGHFQFPKTFHSPQLLISHAQLKGLLAGFDFIRMADYPSLNFDYYF